MNQAFFLVARPQKLHSKSNQRIRRVPKEQRRKCRATRSSQSLAITRKGVGGDIHGFCRWPAIEPREVLF